ncbi:LytTR family transcriptional regulator DNA-binding domain-containing protein [Bacteroidota bacterium]
MYGNLWRNVLINRHYRIAYFFSEDRYTYVVTKDDRKHIISYNLTELESRLDPEEFFQNNRKFIVSFNSIGKMSAHTKSWVKRQLMPDPPYSMEAIVNVEKSGEFKKWLNN